MTALGPTFMIERPTRRRGDSRRCLRFPRPRCQDRSQRVPRRRSTPGAGGAARRDALHRGVGEGVQHDRAERLLLLGDGQRGRATGASRGGRARDNGSYRGRRDRQGKAVHARRSDAQDPPRRRSLGRSNTITPAVLARARRARKDDATHHHDATNPVSPTGHTTHARPGQTVGGLFLLSIAPWVTGGRRPVRPEVGIVSFARAGHGCR